MSDLTPEKLAELRRLAEACPMPDNDPDTLREWYAIGDLTERNYPIPPLDAAFIAAASPNVVLGLLGRLVHMTEAPDVAELRRRLEALPGFALKHLHGGPGGESYIGLGDEGGMPLSDSGFDAVLLFAEIAALEVPRLLDRLAHMTEARDNARAEVERLTAKLDAIEADDDKLSIMFGWLVYDVGEHTCGGYGPESGYAHEPGCGFQPVLRLDKLEGWPGEKPLDGAES